MQDNNTRNHKSRSNDKDTFIPPKFNFEYAIPQPSKADHLLEINAVDAEISMIDARIAEINESIAKIDTAESPEQIAATADVAEKTVALNAAQENLDAAKNNLNKVVNQINALREEINTITKESKNIKSLAQLKARLEELEYVQAHTSLDNSERREIQKEIAMLGECKSKLGRIDTINEEIARLNAVRENFKKLAGEKLLEQNSAKKDLFNSKKELFDIRKQQKTRYESVRFLKSEIDGLRREKTELFNKKQAIREAFKLENNNWFNQKNEAREQSLAAHKMMVATLREEWEAKAEERKQQRRKKQLENAKIDPNVEEIKSIEKYMNYLMRDYDPKKDTKKQRDMSVIIFAAEAKIDEIPSSHGTEEIIAICSKKIDGLKQNSADFISKKIMALEESWAAEDKL